MVRDFVNHRTCLQIVRASITTIDKNSVTAWDDFCDSVCLDSVKKSACGILHNILSAICK